MEFKEILENKIKLFGDNQTAYNSAAEEYAVKKMIQENESILKMAELHMDERAKMVLTFRIDELKALISS